MQKQLATLPQQCLCRVLTRHEPGSKPVSELTARRQRRRRRRLSRVPGTPPVTRTAPIHAGWNAVVRCDRHPIWRIRCAGSDAPICAIPGSWQPQPGAPLREGSAAASQSWQSSRRRQRLRPMSSFGGTVALFSFSCSIQLRRHFCYAVARSAAATSAMAAVARPCCVPIAAARLCAGVVCNAAGGPLALHVLLSRSLLCSNCE